MTHDWHATFLDDRVTMAAAQRHATATGEDGWAAAVALAGRVEPGLGNRDAIGAAAVIAPERAREKAAEDEWQWRETFSWTSSGLPPEQDWTPAHPAAIPRPPGATYDEYARRYEAPTPTGGWTLAPYDEPPLEIVEHIEQQPGRVYRPGNSRPVRAYYVVPNEIRDLVLRYQQNRNAVMQQFMQQWAVASGFVADFVFVDEAVELSEVTHQQWMRSQLIEVLRLARNQTRLEDWPADVLACEAMTEARSRQLVLEDPPRRAPNRRIRLTPLGRLTMLKIHGKRQ